MNCYHIMAAFQLDDLFTLCFHVRHDAVQLLRQIVLQLLIAGVFDLPSQVFTVTNTLS